MRISEADVHKLISGGEVDKLPGSRIKPTSIGAKRERSSNVWDNHIDGVTYPGLTRRALTQAAPRAKDSTIVDRNIRGYSPTNVKRTRSFYQ